MLWVAYIRAADIYIDGEAALVADESGTESAGIGGLVKRWNRRRWHRHDGRGGGGGWICYSRSLRRSVDECAEEAANDGDGTC